MQKRTCLWCGLSIEHLTARAKACGKLCAQQLRRHPGKTLADLTARNCLSCGVPIGHLPTNAKCCSRACNYWAKTRPGEPRPVARNCCACGVDISHLSIQAKTCSKICGWWSHTYPGVLRTTSEGRQCEGCSATISGRRADAQFCSRDCKNRAKSKVYREQNRYPLAEYLARNPGKRREYKNRYRARKYGNDGYVEVTEQEWQRIVRQYRGCCAYCGIRPDELTVDHVVPVSKGGRHAPANLVPACRECNSTKNSRFLIAWKLEIRKGGARASSAAANSLLAPVLRHTRKISMSLEAV